MTDNKPFEWSKERAAEFAFFFKNMDTNNVSGAMDMFEQNHPEQSLPKVPERITVKHLGLDREYMFGSKPESVVPNYLLILSRTINVDKFPAIKKAIEDCLNESDTIDIDWASKPVTEKYYKQSEVDAMMEEYGKKCFNAAKAKDTSRAEYFKEIKYSNGMIDVIYPDRYITFQDYKNSLPENQSKPSAPLPLKEEGKTVTDNSDVACLSLNDLLDAWHSWEEKKEMHLSKSYQFYVDGVKYLPLYKRFEKKVKEKLKQL